MNIFCTRFNYQGRLEKIRKLMDEPEMDFWNEGGEKRGIDGFLKG